VNQNELTVRSLSTGYPGRPVIRNITLAPIRSGEVTALVGPNAAGKSTLLRALAGLLPARGEAVLGDTDILRLPAKTRANIVGFMPQTAPQAAGLTVLEGMLSALHLTGSPRNGSFLDQAIGVLSRIGIADLALEPLHRLSGGQRQLASFAQSIVRQPKLLLLDEPTSALDLRHQFETMSLVREYVCDGRIAIVVLHDLTFAARWADNIVVMANGRPECVGAPSDAITPHMLASVYGVAARVERCALGFPQVNVDGRMN
jgi:iron complex transport system ATP-binding protein